MITSGSQSRLIVGLTRRGGRGLPPPRRIWHRRGADARHAPGHVSDPNAQAREAQILCQLVKKLPYLVIDNGCINLYNNYYVLKKSVINCIKNA